jgi:nicotinate-nucleotide pyrophosphorylase (carboxylating)
MRNYEEQLKKIIEDALQEDLGPGDYSTLSTISKDQKGSAVLKVKDEGIIAGVSVAEKVFKQVQPSAIFHQKMNDGDEMHYGDVAFTLDADVHTILTCERLALNIMQRMTGIATLTNSYVRAVDGYHTKILDTRKTTPNFRLLEKEAVRIGGAENHRMGLYDLIMLKDNHIDYCGGITKAIDKAYNYVREKNLGIKIEVETRDLNDVRLAVASQKVDIIMLDNFSPDLIVEALTIIDKSCETEASGGINLENIKYYAATGVDYISAGALIHQAKSADLSLKAVINI